MIGNKIDPAVAFGLVLRRLRKEAGFTQEGFSFESNVQRNFISLIELGQNQPTVTTIFKLASALRIAPSRLFEQVEFEMTATNLKVYKKVVAGKTVKKRG